MNKMYENGMVETRMVKTGVEVKKGLGKTSKALVVAVIGVGKHIRCTLDFC